MEELTTMRAILHLLRGAQRNHPFTESDLLKLQEILKEMQENLRMLNMMSKEQNKTDHFM